jgi:hypothetical protein
VFTEQLPNNGRLFWLRYSGFRRHVTIYMPSLILSSNACPNLPSYISPSDFVTKILFAFYILSIAATKSCGWQYCFAFESFLAKISARKPIILTKLFVIFFSPFRQFLGLCIRCGHEEFYVYIHYIHYIQTGPKSVNCLVKRALKHVRNFFITCWIYKNFSKWNSQCSLCNSQRSDTFL